MNEELQNLKSKVENGGSTPDGRVSAAEWNTLVGAVKTIDKEGYKGPQGPQGPQGNSGYTGAADELEVVNDLQQGGATSALSAEMGKELTRYCTFGRLIGAGATFVSNSYYGIVAGHKYRVNVKTPDWDISSLTSVGDTSYKWQILYKLTTSTTETTLFRVTKVAQSDALGVVEPSYIFTAPANIEYLKVGGRNIAGAPIDFTIEDITQTNVLSDFFVGNSNTFSSKALFLRKNHSYKVSLPLTEWKFDNRIGSGTAVFNIFYYDENGAAQNIVRTDTFASVKSEYYFKAPIDGLYYIGGRADAGTNVYFFIEDVSYDWGKIVIQGKGSTFNQTKIYDIVPNRNYRLSILTDLTDWEIGNMETSQASLYQLQLYYYTKDSEFTMPVGRKFGDPANIKTFYDFAIDANVDVDRVYLGIRATSGTTVTFRLDMLPAPSLRDGHKNSIVLEGQNNAGVTTRFFLQAGLTYRCYLPAEMWDLSGVTLTYDYNYFEFGKITESGGMESIKTWNIAYGTTQYRPSFEFVADYTAEYNVYIRATQGEKIPIFILPASDSSDISVFEEQIYRAGTLGFRRQTNSAPSANYIPTLTFLHISDTHCTNTAYIKPFKRTCKIFNEISTKDVGQGKNAKFILHTGDVRYGHYSDGYEFFDQATADLKRNIYVTAGNHDVGNSYLVSQCGTDAQVYAQMVEPMLDKWELKTDGGGTPHPNGQNYYFTDFTDEKIRLIVIYEYETDYQISASDSTQLLHHRGYRAFRQAQIDWLIESLQTVPAGYGVIIAKHQPEATSGILDNPFFSGLAGEAIRMQSYCGTTLIADIVQAFIDRASIDKSVNQTGGVVTTLRANASFVNVAEGAEFIGYCSGHTHQDLVNFLRDYPDQLELNIGPNNVHYTTGSDMLQEEGEKSQNLINVYNIDRNRGYVYIVRIGADFSNTAQDRSFTAIKYRKNE